MLTTKQQPLISTPALHHPVAGSMSDSEDKKRNKLGYQRISIACAHCRRRKIRCLLAEGDNQERCQNCIRLKKECVFYPVDQQQVLDNRSQSGSKSGGGSVPSSAVSLSPPELASGRPFERSRQYGSFPSLPSLPSNAPPGFSAPLGPGATLHGHGHGQGDFLPGFPGPGISDSDPAGGPPSEYAFQQPPTDSQRHWEQVNDLSPTHPSMSRARDSMQPQYWRSSPTVPSADFAPFPQGASSASQMPPPPQDASFPYHVPSTQAWHPSQTARSVSYGPIHEVGPAGYIPSSVGYPPQPAHEGQPAGAAAYQNSGATHATSLPPGSGHHSIPLGAPMMNFGQPHPYMFQPQGALSASPVPPQQQYPNQWYGGASPYGPPGQEMRASADNRPFTSKP